MRAGLDIWPSETGRHVMHEAGRSARSAGMTLARWRIRTRLPLTKRTSQAGLVVHHSDFDSLVVAG